MPSRESPSAPRQRRAPSDPDHQAQEPPSPPSDPEHQAQEPPSRRSGDPTAEHEVHEGRATRGQAREKHPRSGDHAAHRDQAERNGGSLDGLLASREIVVACGPGGVGKTTTAAAAGAMAAWRHGGKVLVLTIDPARRLADALGMDGIGNRESRVPDEAFAAAGVKPRGELWAAMLDTKESWDALIRRHAPDDRTRDEILRNPLYGQISGRFVQSHDYIAMERLYEIHSEGDYDLIVVDTPPTRNALDFLDAPERMADFFQSRLLRWLIVPYRSRLVNMASRPFYQVADRILGTQFLEDISQFFILFHTMYDGFIERAQAVGRLLAERRTTFVVVTTLEAAPLHEGQVFVRELSRRHLHVGAVVLNKVLPSYLRDPSGRQVAEKLKDASAEIAEKLAAEAALRDVDSAQLARVLGEVGTSYLDYNLVAQREAEQRAEMAETPDVLVSVPYFDTDVYDLTGLVRLGERLWG
jgi:anion-transporting  ArsA/GET3 family ATPase